MSPGQRVPFAARDAGQDADGRGGWHGDGERPKAVVESDGNREGVRIVHIDVGIPVIISVTGARLDGETYPLVKRDTVWMDSYHPGWRSDADNTPGVFLADVKHRHLHLWHAPSADGTLLLEVERYPLEDLAWSSRLTATPELPERLHRYLPHYIAGHAFQKQDGNTHRSSNAADHLSQWRKAVGGGRSAQQMRDRDHSGGRLLVVRGRQW